LSPTPAATGHNGDNSDDQECSATNMGTPQNCPAGFVPMNFMQFFGFRTVPVQDEAIAENLTNLDIIVVFDVSGSMEDQTICHDCWVKTTNSPNYPNNGYFNPIPYDPRLLLPDPTNTDNQSIPQSGLCTIYPPSRIIPTNT
jgi:hypothetical protein